MEVSKLLVPQEKAEQVYQECGQALKDYAHAKKSEFIKDMRKLHNQLRKKKKIIDIYASFHKVGLTDTGDPKLAIAPANQRMAFFKKLEKGAGVFMKSNPNRWGDNLKEDVRLPLETWEEWPMKINGTGDQTWKTMKDRNRQTVVPAIPANILLLIPKNRRLDGYHILFEAKKWSKYIPPKDPMLLKQITPNLFTVIGAWNLTKLERAVMRGRILG